MSRKVLWVAILTAFVAAAGCAPRVRIRPSPGPHDTGLRYYRPKPYLKIEPASQIVTEGKTSTATPSDEFVAISLEYLPDFSEEYSIDVRPGLGSANVSIGLENGWNLTSLGQELDSQFDENVEAIAALTKSAAGFVPTAKSASEPTAGSMQKFVVAATNVPVGYYESVISKDACGRKRLYGWRYIGFLPFSPCPTEMCGSQHLQCGAVPSDLFGIVFENGVMTFKRLDSIEPGKGLEKVSVSTGQLEVSGSVRQKLDVLVAAVRKAILVNEGVESIVDATLSSDSMSVELSIELVEPIEKVIKRDRFIKSVVSFEEVEAALKLLGDPIPSFTRLSGLQADQTESRFDSELQTALQRVAVETK